MGSVAGRLHVIMANAISVHTTLHSENLRIPELAPFIGKRVQIIVVEEDLSTAESARDRATESAAPQPASPTRTLGSLHGLLHVPDDFEDPLPDEIQRAFEGEADE
jgi:hypothetical protein